MMCEDPPQYHRELKARTRVMSAISTGDQDPTCSSSSCPVSVTLTATDIHYVPGATVSEPLESHAVPALKWWLLCRGLKVPTSWRLVTGALSCLSCSSNVSSQLALLAGSLG